MNIAELPDTTTARLMAVADIIEHEPARYRQGEWWGTRDDGFYPTPDPHFVYGRAVEGDCNTVGCIAGWAVALTPRPRTTTYWSAAGASALGLSMGLASYLFTANFKASPATVADMLRRIARLPEGERTLSNIPLVLNDDQLRILASLDPDDPDGGDDDRDDDDDDVEPYTLEPPDEVAPEHLVDVDARLLVSA